MITGASAGIGRATAEAFGRRGRRVALLARGVDGLEGARAAIQAAGGEALAISTDLHAPVAGDHGAHGRFDAQAVDSSLQLWFDLHRRTLGAVLALGLAPS